MKMRSRSNQLCTDLESWINHQTLAQNKIKGRRIDFYFSNYKLQEMKLHMSLGWFACGMHERFLFQNVHLTSFDDVLCNRMRRVLPSNPVRNNG